MARKRMFDMQIVDTDIFLEMPQSTQNLYFHLGMRADDDGFVSNPKKIIKIIGANEDDLKILIVKKFIIPFETGVIVIRHWKLNNYLRKDRYIETIYKEEKRQLIEDENGIYNLGIPNDNQMTTSGIRSIDESSIDESSIDESSCSNQNSEIIKCYEENIGLITPATAEILFSYNDIDYKMIIEAIKIASINNKRNCRYIQGILNSWINKGYKVVADIQKEQEEHIETKEERIARLKKEYGVEDED